MAASVYYPSPSASCLGHAHEVSPIDWSRRKPTVVAREWRAYLREPGRLHSYLVHVPEAAQSFEK